MILERKSISEALQFLLKGAFCLSHLLQIKFYVGKRIRETKLCYIRRSRNTFMANYFTKVNSTIVYRYVSANVYKCIGKLTVSSDM